MRSCDRLGQRLSGVWGFQTHDGKPKKNVLDLFKLVEMRKESKGGFIVATGFRDSEGDTILRLYCSDDKINAEYNFGDDRGEIVEVF